MRSKVITRGIAGAAAMAGRFSLAGHATGANYAASSPDFVPVPTQEKVASNWYVRGDLAYAQETYPEIAPDSTFVSSPSVLNAYSVGAGFGYKVNDWFRTDLILDYRSKVQAAGSARRHNASRPLTPREMSPRPTFAPVTSIPKSGVGIAMTDHAQLDVGYRFLDLGAISGFSGMTGTSVSQRVFVNELRAGVRYMID